MNDGQKKAHIIGLGKSGIAAARVLKRQGWEVTASDRNTSPSLEETKQLLAQEGIAVDLGRQFSPELSEELIVVSPGVAWDLPGLCRARENGIETIGEMELAWRSLQSRPWIGITGTNGKTTTTALTAAIFEAGGFKAPPCGNIGYAACELALAETEPDWVIAEISSYQIESSISLAPRIGVWTTFTPDHLSRHYTLEKYFGIKEQLLMRSQLKVVNGDDPYLRENAGRWSDAFWTSVGGKAELIGDPQWGTYIEDGEVIVWGEAVAAIADLRMLGNHNQQNLLMAVAAAKLAGIGKEAMARGIATFPGMPHRLEHICTWEGVDFINDSKATNYDAAEVGLRAVSAPAILIAGGQAKEGDSDRWLEVIKEKAAAVLLIGDAAEDFARQLHEVDYRNFEIVETMERAVPRSGELAKEHDGKVVLLSPACASFDQYRNFEERGDRFRQLCQELANGE